MYHVPKGQRGVTLLELMLALAVAFAVVVALMVLFGTARENAAIADLRDSLLEITTAARSARPAGDFTGLAGANALSSLGRFAPDRLTDTGALRGPVTTTLRIEATPAAVIPDAHLPAATGQTRYFDVVIDNLSPSLCEAFVRAIETERWPRIQVGASVYTNRLVSPVVNPSSANLASTTHCRPTGTQQVSVRITAA